MPRLTLTDWLKQELTGREDGFSLSLFRAWLGVIITWEAVYLWRLDFAEYFIARPPILFPYGAFAWLPRPSKTLTEVIIAVLVAAGIAVAVGYRSRIALAVYGLGFGYLFVLDRAYYNNHLYLVVLMALMMALMPLDANVALRREQESHIVPAWGRWALRSQLIIVYFYGGIAKLAPDWLIHEQPARAIAASKSLTGDVAPFLLTYGGLGFDLLVGPALIYRPTRPYALAGALLFNAANAWIFDDINIFPFLMAGALLLFIEPDEVRRRLGSTPPKAKKSKKSPKLAKPPEGPPERWIFWGLGAYFALQVILPFRHAVLPGPVDWTGEAQRFSWRMKIQHRQVDKLNFRIYDFDTKQIVVVDRDTLRNFGFNSDQLDKVARDPDALTRMARFLADDHQKRQRSSKVEVKGDVVVRFNGRPPQPWVDPDVDLTQGPLGYAEHHAWIKPLAADPVR